MKKFFLFIIPAIILTLIVFLVYELFFVKSNAKGALQVTAIPESNVYLNGKLIGKTPLCRCVIPGEAPNLLPVGEYTLRIVPTSENFSEYQEKIVIRKALMTVVDRKFGEGGQSEGSVITLNPIHDKNVSHLLIVSVPDEADVLLDDTVIGKTPLMLKDVTESDHKLTIKKNGYKEKTVAVHTSEGFKLEATIYLSVLELVEDKEASSSAQPPSIAKVRILDTPTGFLRVRDSNSLSGLEIGRVSPGETFEMTQEDTSGGWFQIKLPDGTIGWVSAQYAQKE